MNTHELSPAARHELLVLAREAIAEWLRSATAIEYQPRDPVLDRPRGAFVSLHRAGELRGCIGNTEPVSAMWRTVRDMAIAAAVRDPRFPPLTELELEHTDIEVSILDPSERISGADEVTVGEHGLTIALAGRRGLLLPQVASERGWDAPTFLAMVSRKAGLSDDAWRDPRAVLERFTAQVFGETAERRPA